MSEKPKPDFYNRLTDLLGMEDDKRVEVIRLIKDIHAYARPDIVRPYENSELEQLGDGSTEEWNNRARGWNLCIEEYDARFSDAIDLDDSASQQKGHEA